ncbi:MAG: hypothetical protein PHC34_09085 [Candidatus Gastranaerophilales bacterium]|nr:hypothetical protein [Candidatus Gastranaerophilales bacterium]
MVNNQVIMTVESGKQEINRNVVARKPDLTYDLETILEKLLDRVEVYEKY